MYAKRESRYGFVFALSSEACVIFVVVVFVAELCAAPQTKLPPDCPECYLAQSDEIASMTSLLPRMVQGAVNVNLCRWRHGRGKEASADQEEGVIDVLEGWKATMDALDQSLR